MTCSCGNPMCDGTCCNNAACCSDTTCNTGNIVSVSNAACVTDCGCLPATPIPYYNSAPGCEETHSRLVIQNQFVTGLSIATAFNMPACDGTAMLTIPGLQLVSLGSYLWNTAYGYLKIESFDYASSTIIVKNECQDGNIAAGTAIPACTIFNVVDTPVGIDNPCTNSPVATGALVVCADGVAQPLDAASVGQIPVVTNAATNEVEFQSLEIPERVCVELLADITLIPGNAGPYTLNVASTSGYTLNTILQIAGRADRFTVQTTPDITHATAIVSPVPGGFEVIPSGSDVCLAPCCEQVALDALTYTNSAVAGLDSRLDVVEPIVTGLDSRLDIVEPILTNTTAIANSAMSGVTTYGNLISNSSCDSVYLNSPAITPTAIDVGGSYTTPELSASYFNAKSLPATVLVRLDYYWYVAITKIITGAVGFGRIIPQLSYGVGTVPDPGTFTTYTELYATGFVVDGWGVAVGNIGRATSYQNFNHEYIIVCPVGQYLTVRSRLVFTLDAMSFSGPMEIYSGNLQISLFAVTLP